MTTPESHGSNEWEQTQNGWTRRGVSDDLRQSLSETNEESAHSDWEQDPAGGWRRKSTLDAAPPETPPDPEQQRATTNLELLRGQETNAELLEKTFAAAVQRYPELSHVHLVQKDKHTPGAFARHQFHERNSTGSPEVHMDLSPGSEEQLFTALQERPRLIEIISQKIGIPPEQFTPQLAQAFTLLHELGHTLDYTHNIESQSEGAQRDAQRREEMQRLPIRNSAPARLLNPETQAKLLQSYPDLFEGLTRQYGQPITSMADVLALQEVYYRQLPSEAYADDFAVAVLRGEHFEPKR